AATPAPDVAAAMEAAVLAEDTLDEAKAQQRKLREELQALKSAARKAQESQKAAQTEADSLRFTTAEQSDDRGLSTGSISGIVAGVVIFIIIVAVVVGGFFVFRNRNSILRREVVQSNEEIPLVPAATPNLARPMQAIEEALRAQGISPATPSSIRTMEQRGTSDQEQRPSFASNMHDTNRSDSGYDDVSPRTTGGQSVDRTCSPAVAALFVADEERTSQPRPVFESDFLKNWKPIKILGQGGYGCVFEAEYKLIKERFAVKRIPLRYPSGLKKDADVIAEAAYLSKMDHPNIVRYHHSWIEHPPVGWQREADDMMLREMNSDEHLFCGDRSAFFYIQMELCQSTLADWMRDNSRRDLKRMKHWFKQIVSAVGYMHLNGMIHRDLKPGNILFADEDRLKICDLGITTVRAINEGQENAKTRTFGKGTSMYMAPEQKGYNYKCKVDIFALGLILAELCVPMSDEQAEEVFDNYRKGRKSDVLSNLPEVETFVGWLTKVVPDDRPECSEILKNIFLA
ncbi:hypothetical protein PENTCL1PPCAC_8322, partial [Pristionchus entomophagus]